MIEAVIFDWAGTTVDYGCFAPVQAFQEVFRSFGVEPTLEETRKPMGMLKRDHIRTMLHMDRIAEEWKARYGALPAEKDVDALYAVFEEKLLSILSGFVDIKPGVLEAAEALRAQGVRIGSTTGYTDRMMGIVAPIAAQNGYAPDYWISPDSTGGFGRPYPYMIFRNLEKLSVQSVQAAAKVGDTVSDIREGKNAGVYTIGVLEGSSEMGLARAEYEALAPTAQAQACAKAAAVFRSAGADAVIRNMAELPALLRQVR